MSHDIVIVDDESDIRNLLSGILGDEGYIVRVAADVQSALSVISSRKPSLVILDVWLGNHEHDGFRILEFVKVNYPYIPVIMISGHGNIDTAIDAIKKGAYDFLEKPFQTEKFLLVVKRALETASLKRENESMKVSVNGVLAGTSTAINQARAKIEKASNTNTRVFITSHIGFNRELVAKEIHLNSKRSQGPFISISCACVKNQLDKELFGCEISSLINKIPGISKKNLGAIEKAHTGTIFIDHIDQAPKNFQGKIVKFLQEQSFCSLGSSRKISVDVRIITGSANKNYKEDLSDELLSRINIINLDIPSINERVQDIPYLINYWINEFSISFKKPRVIKIDHDALILLESYSWPGDVEQMKNVIESLVLLSKADLIKKEDLPLDMLDGNSFVAEWQKKTADIVTLPLREAREVFEKEYLAVQVHRFAGNISRTAQFIGMERSALHRKLKTLGFYDEKKNG